MPVPLVPVPVPVPDVPVPDVPLVPLLVPVPLLVAVQALKLRHPMKALKAPSRAIYKGSFFIKKVLVKK